VAGADTHEDAGGAGAHEVQGGLVGGAAADDDGHVEAADEGLEVERFDGGRDVLGGDDGALDDEHVQLALEDVGQEGLGALRGDRGTRHDAGVVDLADPLGDQLGADGLLVELLHPLGGLLDRLGGDLGEHAVGVLEAGPEALEVEYADAAEAADGDGRGGADDAVHGGGHEGQVETVGIDLPGDVDVLGVACAAARHDGDVVEAVRPTTALAQPDLDLRHACGPLFAPVEKG
jgi:hypothetical protein